MGTSRSMAVLALDHPPVLIESAVPFLARIKTVYGHFVPPESVTWSTI